MTRLKSEDVFHPFSFERVDFGNNFMPLMYCLVKGRWVVMSTNIAPYKEHASGFACSLNVWQVVFDRWVRS